MHIKLTPVIKGTANLLPASKSISNRALIVNALAGGKPGDLHNLSDANDTQLMQRLIHSEDTVIDVEDAGTTMRFLAAYFSVMNQNKVLTGTTRMKERPIGILVDALRSLGVRIEYHEQEGYPPIEVNGFTGQKTNTLDIRGDVSSQYISALMMVAPLLPEGLTLNLKGKVGSRPYINMTASIMERFGIKPEIDSDKITVPAGRYQPTPYTVESDWSAASYWFAIAALANEATIQLPKLSNHSLQGDSIIQKIMEPLGVTSRIEDGLLYLTQRAAETEIKVDFTDCPDLAQTVAVVCSAKAIKGHFTGLESLRIKETDRIAALQKELTKIGAQLIEDDPAHWRLIPSGNLPRQASFNTYKDHRMAMAFAPLATKMDVTMERPEVVRKSYPNFWNDLKTCGFEIDQ
jgi:3-phosphoshikimate 1-carboxyvinyltransferase